jgi:hypothetical protein
MDLAGRVFADMINPNLNIFHNLFHMSIQFIVIIPGCFPKAPVGVATIQGIVFLTKFTISG